MGLLKSISKSLASRQDVSQPSYSERRSMFRTEDIIGNDSNLLIVFYVQIMPDDFVMQLHRF